MRKIAIANNKGGVAKTTTTANLGVALAKRGKRVLLVDVDPQASLTLYMRRDPFALEERKQTLYHALVNGKEMQDIVISGTPDIVPSSILLSEAEGALMADWGAVGILREKLEPLVQNYDFILLDCPPTLTLLTANAIAAADQVLVPVKTDYLSMMGLRLILESVEKLRARANRNLEVLGVLPTMYFKRNRHDNEVLEMLREAVEPKIRLFDPIPNSTLYNHAAAEGAPLVETSSRAPGVAEYQKLADEIIRNG